MINFPRYKITCEKFEVITEDPEMMREYITQFLEKTDEVVVKRLK
ncbi:hypothetical protein SAMN05216392_0359 [Streptococcus equinus]|uniref:Uncharacterized protein n=1 Tax=Streptococcus equinus TaxID=1335 RepID=A0A1H0Y1Q0_STREI|nr:hypothetical protein Javan214_0020 [Streptococcus phage Javan214]SDQ08981.1 hypothetical protein SAMN05216392_0359 [Streptococcus equinus]